MRRHRAVISIVVMVVVKEVLSLMLSKIVLFKELT